NNVDQEAFVYRNNARTLSQNRYLQVQLEAEGANRFAVGAKVTLWSGKEQFFQEEESTRGFQSSVDYVLTFGVGQRDTIDSVTVRWPDGRGSVSKRVATNERVFLRQSQAVAPPVPSPALQDRLYLNDGRGHFRKAIGNLPTEYISGSRVVAADYDGDGDLDLFVGGRVVPWRYGVDPQSMLLQNDGHGHFTDVTAQLAP